MKMKNFVNVKNLVLCLAILLLMALAAGCNDNGKAQEL